MTVHLRNHLKTDFEEVRNKENRSAKEGKATTSSVATLQPDQHTIEHLFGPILKVLLSGKPWLT